MARILLVSSGPQLLCTRQTLLREGHEVVSCSGVAAGLEHCKWGRFDVVVLGSSLRHSDKTFFLRTFRRNCLAPVICVRGALGEQAPDGVEYNIEGDPQSVLKAVAKATSRVATVSFRGRILVADDHEVVRKGLCALLQSAGWEICGEAADGRDAVQKARELKPDIVILDVGMPNLNGLEATRQILHHNPEQKVLVLTISDTDQVVRAVVQAGARGFVLKSDAARDLVTAVEALLQHRTFFTQRVAEMMLDAYCKRADPVTSASIAPTLTPREREIVQLISEGKSSKEVASVLNLSVKTAETHRSNIMRKLKVHSIGELVLYAIRNNIIQVPTSPAQTSYRVL